MRLIGIDLAARTTNVSGIATYEDGRIRTYSVYSDENILEIIKNFKPDVVAIDAPLVVVDKPFRSAEKEMQQLGYKLLPLNMPDMLDLAKRASSIKYAVENITKLIECHSSSTKKALNVNNTKELKNVKFLNIVKNEHESDAIFAVVTALFFKENNYDSFGDDEEGYIIIPKF
jgi:predicted nuclease with RNAse H fold